MQIYHLTQKDYKVGKWSGGTTTQLYIWPQNANYEKRDFCFRISSATVDLEQSDFTPLNGITRYITPVFGGFTLTHPNGNPMVMTPLDEPYCFYGETPTHCIGKATDFNLMLKDTKGNMSICDNSWNILSGFNCLYAVQKTTIKLQKTYTILPNEMLVIFSKEDFCADISTKSIICHVVV